MLPAPGADPPQQRLVDQRRQGGWSRLGHRQRRRAVEPATRRPIAAPGPAVLAPEAAARSSRTPPAANRCRSGVRRSRVSRNARSLRIAVAISSGRYSPTQCAASSMPSGMPSSRRHRRATPSSVAVSPQSRAPGAAPAPQTVAPPPPAAAPLRARPAPRKPPRMSSSSPYTPSRSREVASTRRFGAAASSSATSGPTAGRCSQLSRTSSSARSRSTSRSSSAGVRRAPVGMPSAARIVPASPSVCAVASPVALMPTRCTQQAPAEKASRRASGCRERQAGLAHAARAEQCHQACLATQEPIEQRQLLLAA